MVRELAIGLYLYTFKILFNIFKLFPVRNKVTFVVSFGENSLFVYEEMKKQNISSNVIILQKKSCNFSLNDSTEATVIDFETGNIVNMVRSIYHLATSNYVVVDNYYGFLAAISFKQGVQCIQLWHASGALKKFGLQDQSTAFRSKRAQARFVKVYEKFNKVVVGSDEMAKVFMEAFNLPASSILRTGVPRTDLFYDVSLQNKIKQQLYSENPLLKSKKVILYAPTYRDGNLNEFNLMLDIEKMYEAFKDDYILLVKLHPAVRNKIKLDNPVYKNFLYDYSTIKTINYLLLVTDILITDYSSIPYEYSLLNKPILFYAYDLEAYNTDRGLPEDYFDQIPGPLVKTTEEVIKVISMNQFDLKLVEAFANRWNRYSNGKSAKNLLAFMYQERVIENNLQEQQQQVL